jgi:ceramide glucosyltransferase
MELAAAWLRRLRTGVILNFALGSLAALSLLLLLWQWLAARRFPLHRRIPVADYAPPVTLLKPLKGCDAATEDCLRSWLQQDYSAPIQVLFAVASPDDPVCAVVQKLIREFPQINAELVIVQNLLGPNAKVSKLAELEPRAKFDVLVVSDADVRVPADFLKNAVAPLLDSNVGLVNCFYRLANPMTLAMRCEAIAINADFWSQVLQARMLKPLDFALGAVMITRRAQLREIGGFAALADCLADDYQLGNRIARRGHRIELCSCVVECWDSPMGWPAVWRHQLRWARTIRVCQPLPYFFSILSNPVLWPLLWAALVPNPMSIATLGSALVLRCLMAVDLQWLLTGSARHVPYCWLAPIKDLLQLTIWLGAFLGNSVEWRGQRFTLRSDGSLVKRG